jgi:hypothetical protein
MPGFFDTLFGGGAEKEAAEKNRQLAQQYQQQSLGALGTQYGASTGYGQQAVSAYDPLTSLATKYGKGGDLYLDALGVNGPEAQARATASFQTTPGYNITQKAALDAIDRRRAIGGMYSSGNADIDTGNWITKNLYENQYAPWLAGLQGAGAQGQAAATTAAGGRAAGYGNLAGLAERYGTNQTNVYGTTTSGMMDANKLQAAGEAAGAKNLWGAGMGLATAALTAGMGGGGLGSLGSLFGSGSGSMNSTPWSFPMATEGGNWGRPNVAYG